MREALEQVLRGEKRAWKGWGEGGEHFQTKHRYKKN